MTGSASLEWKKPGAAPETAELELYDYQADPGETKNLAAERPQEVSVLRAILGALPDAPYVTASLELDSSRLKLTAALPADPRAMPPRAATGPAAARSART